LSGTPEGEMPPGFRMSIGAVSLEEIRAMFPRVREALAALK